MRKPLAAVAVALAALLALAQPAYAHHCTNANKKAGAGSFGVYNVVTGVFTQHQRNGGFLTFTDGENTFDIYWQHTLPDEALAAGPEGDNQCDGQAIEDVLDCLGIPH